MNLVLFAHYFPYKRSEPFLVTEFKAAGKYFSSISIFTLYGGQPNSSINTATATCYKPIFDSGSKVKLFFKGLFNLAPFGFHIRELIQKNILFKPKKAYWWFVSVLVTRSILSSSSYKQMVADLKQNGPATLYFYWGDNLCWIIPYLQKQLAGKHKIVVRLHGSDLYEHIKADYAPLRTDIFKAVQAIYTVSENGKKYLANRYPAFAGKMHLARLGVFDNGLNPPTDSAQKVIMSVSNLIPLKRVHLIFEALQAMNAEITWHHFGDGPLMPDMVALASTARKGLHITFHGFVKNEEVMNFYKRNPVNVFINVSTSEGVPVSIMEAFSFGIPVIATNVGGTSELVNAQTGVLLKKDLTVNELAEAIKHIVNADGHVEKEYRANARAAFLEKASLNNYEAFYTELKRPA